MSEQNLSPFDSLQAEVTLLVRPVLTLAVVDGDSDLQAAETLRKLRAMSNRIEAKRKELTQPLLEQKRSIDDYADKVTCPIAEAETHVKIQRKAWADLEVKRIREEKERLQAVERERAAQEAKKRREEQEVAEAKRREEERTAREKFAAGQKARDEEADRQARAAALFKKPAPAIRGPLPGAPWADADPIRELRERQEKERLEEQARAEREEESRRKTFAAEQKRLEASKPKGLRTEKQFEVTDVSKLPQKYLLPNLVEIRKAVLRGEEIPGVRVWEDSIVVSR